VLPATLPILVGLVGVSALGLLFVLARRVRHFGWRGGLKLWRAGVQSESSRVDFYQRLIALLEKQGIKREAFQTPLEFAFAVGNRDAAAITKAYNRVRYGAEKLTLFERKEIEELLARVESTPKRS
jgi:hypothetical protein